MNDLTINNQISGLSLEETLMTLSRHGSPALHQMDDGRWYCRVSMRVASEGVNFEIKSDWIKSPSAAATMCLTRMIETLNKYGVKV